MLVLSFNIKENTSIYIILDGIEGCMRIYCTSHEWWYPTSPVGASGISSFMASAVYSHATRNKAIQYYYYYIIWSWLCSQTEYSSHSVYSCTNCSLLLTEDEVVRMPACVGLLLHNMQFPAKIWLQWLYCRCLHFVHYLSVFVIGVFFELFSEKLAKISCKGSAIVAKLFCLSTIPTELRWTVCATIRGGLTERVQY